MSDAIRSRKLGLAILIAVVVAFVSVAVLWRTRTDAVPMPDALADSFVSFDEYTAWADSIVHCANNWSQDSRAVRTLDRSGMYYDFELVSPDLDSMQSFDSIFEDCRALVGSEVETTWFAQNAISADQLPDALDEFAQCLGSARVAEAPLGVRVLLETQEVETSVVEAMKPLHDWMTNELPLDLSVVGCYEAAGLANLSSIR